MLNGKKVLAVIPARGGSKRIPGKNIKQFHGKPLINWTVIAAVGCDYIDKVVVNSDADEILNAAALDGVTLDKRHASLATDTASSVDVALDILKRFPDFDILVWLQPTSPLRGMAEINGACELFLAQESTESVVSVSETEHSPTWMATLPPEKTMCNFMEKLAIGARSQDLEKHYLINGAIYIIDRNALFKNRAFISRDTYAYIMPREKSIDIDEEIDFITAETLKKINEEQ